MRINVVLSLLLAFALGMLAYAGYKAAQTDSEGLLLVVPQSNSLPGPSLTALEDINEEKCMLTYEVVSEKLVKAINSSYQIRLIGTNYTYPQVMRYRMLSGAFFTKDAQKAQNAQLVLNVAAAFELFGATDVYGNTLYLDNIPYLIAGTIDDHDKENKNLYIPITRLEIAPNAFACRLDEGRGFTQSYVWNALKQAGVTQAAYDEIPLGHYGRTILQKCLLALYITLLTAVYFGMGKALGLWRKKWDRLRDAKQSYYLGELLTRERGSVWALLVLGIGILAAIIILLYAGLYMLQNGLGWPDTAELAKSVTESFTRNIREMQSLCLYADISLMAFALFSVMFCANYSFMH